MTAKGSPLEERAVERAGLRVAYDDVGEGAPVLAIHSGGLSRRQWRRLRDRLAPSHRVLVPDLLGYGASTPWPLGAPFHLERDLEMLHLLLDEAAAPCHLVGHSYGGFLALKLAITRPEAVRSLALFEPVAFGVLQAPADDDAQRVLGRLTLHYDRGAPDGIDDTWIGAFVDWWNGAGTYRSLAPDAREAFRRTAWKVFQEVSSLTTDATEPSSYRALAMPTLLLGGARSPLPAGRVLSRLEEAMPNARRHVFDGVGHMAPISAADVVNAEIATHVARVP